MKDEIIDSSLKKSQMSNFMFFPLQKLYGTL